MTILHSFLLITLFFTAHSSAGYAPAPAPSAAEFIRTSCEVTLYPDICYHTLSEYASAVRNDPSRLATAAVHVSLSCAAGTRSYLANLTRASDYGDDPRAAGAMRDCVSVFGDAVYLIRGSLREMRRLTRGGDPEEMRFLISNVQTWMSAALTNEDTCVDGFDGVGDAGLKAEVCGRTVGVKEVTSNALALVNGYVRW